MGDACPAPCITPRDFDAALAQFTGLTRYDQHYIIDLLFSR